MPDSLLPRDGLVIVAKRDCPTCVLVEPVMQSLDRAGPLTVLSQDDPTFPSGVRSVHYDDSRPYDVGDAWPMFAVTGDSAQACRARAETIARQVEATLERGPSVARPV